MPKLTISLVSANNKQLILDCLASIYATKGALDCEIFVVLNATRDDSEAALRAQYPEVKLLINAERLGFTRNHNMVMCRAEGDYYLVLNDDTIILPHALQRMVDYMETHPRIGILGPRILNADRTLQWSCGKSMTHGLEFFRAGVLRSLLPFMPVRHYTRTQDVTWVTGACLLVRAQAAREVGLLDERIIIYFEDGDWCYRMHKAAWNVVFHPDAEIIHLCGQTRKQHLARDLFIIYQSKFYFFRKHFGVLTQGLVRGFTFVEILLRYAVTLLARRHPEKTQVQELRATLWRLLGFTLLPRQTG